MAIQEIPYNVRKINYILEDVDSCLKLSDFPEHPKNQTNKPHTLVCDKSKGFFDMEREFLMLQDLGIEDYEIEYLIALKRKAAKQRDF